MQPALQDGPAPPRQWWRRAWGRVVLGLGSLLGVVLLIVVLTTIRYWWQLRHGEEPAFVNEWQQQFSASLPPAPPPAAVTRAQIERSDEPFLGRPSSPVVLVEFLDFKCPYCRAAAPIIRQVAEHYGYGVKIIARDFPAENLHPGATALARLGRCAYRQNRYWELSDWLFANQDQVPAVLADADIAAIADQAGLDAALLHTCLSDQTIDDSISRDYVDGAGFGVAGTPTFFLNGVKIEGVVPFSVWQQVLDAALKRAA